MAQQADALRIRDEDRTHGTLGGASLGSLPPDLLDAAVRRVGIIALAYAFTYVMAAFLPPLLTPGLRGLFYREVDHWLPGAVSIAIAIAVAFTMRSALERTVKLRIGMLFEVVASYGIAFAEYHDITSPIMYHDVGVGGFGLSWVTVWVMLFTVAIPSPPRVALSAAVLSLMAIPAVFGLNLALGDNRVTLTGMQFFLSLVFPNLLVLVLASVGARVVYRLGRAVTEAREMGSYRLVERLGKGGMGEVWSAEHRTLARPAAIKLIRPEVLQGQYSESATVIKQRFEREAQATALLRSAHTIELYDFGVTDGGTFYYVMELLDGFDLEELVNKFGPLPPGRTVHFLRDLCDSLGEAHDAGLIHRDVKPANIYACRQGRALDFVKVLDFGLVKPQYAAEDGADQLTAEHSTGGTPAYMSPEQALGSEELDGRSDLYAVGCVGYWLLTGQYVFKGRTAMETIMKHVQDQPDPPSLRSTFDLPAELDDLILRCLAKDRNERPQSADDLRAQLETVPIPEPWTRRHALEWWNEHHPLDRQRFSGAASRPAGASARSGVASTP